MAPCVLAPAELGPVTFEKQKSVYKTLIQPKFCVFDVFDVVFEEMETRYAISKTSPVTVSIDTECLIRQLQLLQFVCQTGAQMTGFEGVLTPPENMQEGSLCVLTPL